MLWILEAGTLNALHHTPHCVMQIYLREGNLMRKVGREWWRKCRQQHGGSLCVCRRTDIECSHMRSWWEATCFFWSTATCIVEVISFSCLSPSKPLSRLGGNIFFNKHLKAVYPSFSLIGALRYSCSLDKQLHILSFAQYVGMKIPFCIMLESLKIYSSDMYPETTPETYSRFRLYVMVELYSSPQHPQNSCQEKSVGSPYNLL